MKNLGIDVSFRSHRLGHDFGDVQDLTVSIVESIPWPLLVLDSDLLIVTANNAFYRTFRVSPFEAEGQSLFSVSNGSWEVPGLRRLLGRVLPDDNAFRDFEIEQDFPAVGYKILELSGCRLDRPQFILLVVHDVTDRKERDSEARLQLAAIMESSDDAILSKTLDGTIISWNAGAERMYGYASHEVIGRPIEILAEQGREEEIPAIMDRIRRGEKVEHYETRRRRKDGAILDVSVTVSPIKGRNGMITGASVMARDITELKRMQREALARQKFESLGRLAGGVAQDFNNLLGGMLSYAELTLTLLPEGSPANEEVQKIRDMALSGAEIVREMMVYAGQESGSFELVDVSRTVAEMLELLRVSISKHAALKAELESGLPVMLARPAQIRQVVMNLVSNASDAIGESDGVIRVATKRVKLDRSSAEESAKNLPEGDYLGLEVSDTGCGMTPDVQAKIFDPFFSTKFADRGLGLSVVQSIIQAHGGSINVQSAPDEGTTIRILLPRAGQTAQTAQNTKLSSLIGKSSLAAKASFAPETVLLVEDEPTLRLAVSKMLRKSGFPVIEASDGSEAVDLIKAHKDEIAVILLDFTLPGLPSQQVFEAARRLRPGIKVIVTSAYSRNIIDASFKGLQGDRFIRKPYALGDLLGLLRDAMSA